MAGPFHLPPPWLTCCHISSAFLCHFPQQRQLHEFANMNALQREGRRERGERRKEKEGERQAECGKLLGCQAAWPTLPGKPSQASSRARASARAGTICIIIACRTQLPAAFIAVAVAVAVVVLVRLAAAVIQSDAKFSLIHMKSHRGGSCTDCALKNSVDSGLAQLTLRRLR